jgi:hypothetical protein
MATLLKKELVTKEKNQYSLTEKGELLAVELYETKDRARRLEDLPELSPIKPAVLRTTSQGT